MSMPIVRRLTATLVLAAVLCLASPAAAADTPRSLSPAAVGLGCLDPILSWLHKFLESDRPLTAGEDARTVHGRDHGELDPGTDGSVTIDPNG